MFFIAFTIVLLGAFSAVPQVQRTHTVDAASAKFSKQFAKRFLETIAVPNDSTYVSISAQELAGLVAVANRTVPNLDMNASMSTKGLAIEATYDTGLPGVIRFINTSGVLLPSSQQLDIEFVKLGIWRINGAVFSQVLEWGLNLALGQSIGSDLLASVDKVTLSETEGSIKVNVPEKFSALNDEQQSRWRALRDRLAIFGEADLVRVYFQHLINYIDKHRKPSDLASYFRQVFMLAKERSANNSLTIVARENQAALLALSVYFGSDKFELMIGDIASLSKKQFYRRNRHRREVTLHGRVDLQKHFIYSAALQIFGSLQTSDALGEFKELLDVNPGGSGFSFADLMADRAGTRLAMSLTTPNISAQQLQTALTVVTDEQLLPSITGLPEGLNETQFKQQYQNVDAEPYLAMVDEIDTRLSKLVLYSLIKI